MAEQRHNQQLRAHDLTAALTARFSRSFQGGRGLPRAEPSAEAEIATEICALGSKGGKGLQYLRPFLDITHWLGRLARSVGPARPLVRLLL